MAHALSGARVGEVAQLWGNRVVEIDGIPVMRIAPAADGGTIKNAGSERDVPIHSAIIERGFLDFVETKGGGPLFYRGTPKNVPPTAGLRSTHQRAWRIISHRGFASRVM